MPKLVTACLATLALVLAVAPAAQARSCDPRFFANRTYSVSQAVGISCQGARDRVRTVRGISARFRLGPFTCRQTGGGLRFRCVDGARSFRFRTIA